LEGLISFQIGPIRTTILGRSHFQSSSNNYRWSGPCYRPLWAKPNEALYTSIIRNVAKENQPPLTRMKRARRSSRGAHSAVCMMRSPSHSSFGLSFCPGAGGPADPGDTTTTPSARAQSSCPSFRPGRDRRRAAQDRPASARAAAAQSSRSRPPRAARAYAGPGT